MVIHWHNSLRPSNVILCHTFCSTLVRVRVCHLFGAKPLPELIWTHYQSDLLVKYINTIWIKIQIYKMPMNIIYIIVSVVGVHDIMYQHKNQAFICVGDSLHIFELFWTITNFFFGNAQTKYPMKFCLKLWYEYIAFGLGFFLWAVHYYSYWLHAEGWCYGSPGECVPLAGPQGEEIAMVICLSTPGIQPHQPEIPGTCWNVNQGL